jgi:proteasome accessory factor A
MSEVQTFVKLASTSLMLMALTEDALGSPIRLAAPVEAVTAVSHDITGTHGLEVMNEPSTTALELQWRYFTLAEAFVDSSDLPPIYKFALSEWRGLLEDYPLGYTVLADRLDWAGKLTVMEGFRERDGLSWNNPKLALLSLQYNDIDPNRSLYHRLVEGGRMRTLFTAEEVEHAAVSPPEGTRAWFRGECLRRYADEVVACNWDSLVFDIGRSTLVRVPMMEPLRGSRDLVEDLLGACPDAAALIDRLGDANDRT